MTTTRTKISALPNIVAPAVSDVFPISQGTTTYKETVTQLITLVSANITSLTGLTGSLQYPTGVVDPNGHQIVQWSYLPNAVNWVRIYNNATGGGPLIETQGTDSSIPLVVNPLNADVWVQDPTNVIASGIRFYNAAGTHYTRLKAATSQATDLSLVLPAVDGSANAPLITDGSGNLSFLPGAWVDWSGTIGFTGFSANPTGITARYKVIGKTCWIMIYMTAGTSNSTSFTITGLPLAAAETQFCPLAYCSDNSTLLAKPVTASITSTTITCVINGANWTNSGTKGVNGNFFYEIA